MSMGIASLVESLGGSGDNCRHIIQTPPPPRIQLRGSRHTIVVHGSKGDCFNPSIVLHGDELVCVVRNVVEGRTTNWLGRLDDRMVFRNGKPLTSPKHLEDLRLYVVGGQLRALGSHNDYNRIHLFRMRVDAAGARLADLEAVASTHNEKNWMPVLGEGPARVVYSASPLVVLADGQPAPVHSVHGHVRGGSQLVPHDGGYLAVVHESYEGGHYVHRFATFDRDLRAVALGPAWFFDDHGIEFCAGAAWWHGRLHLSYGWKDREARVAILTREELQELLPEIPEAEVPTAPPPAPTARLAEISPGTEWGARFVVAHSPHQRCGIGEYGRQLDASLAKLAEVKSRSLADPAYVSDCGPGTTLLVHFEPAIMPPNAADMLRAARARGARVVFCAHIYAPEHLAPYGGLFDAVVAHRPTGTAAVHGGRVVQLPLGCPVYEPADRAAVRARLGWGAERVLLTLGFLSGWKRYPDTLEALLPRIGAGMRVHVQAPMPFAGGVGIAEEGARIREISDRSGGRVSYSSEFLPESELLDMVAAADLGFLFHGQHTGSVSAAAKQFISARTPLIVTHSSHDSDLQAGVHRVATFEPREFAVEVVRLVSSDDALSALRAQLQAEYARLNMDAVAIQYAALAKSLA